MAASKVRATGLGGDPSAVKPATMLPTSTGELRQAPWMEPQGCFQSAAPVRASTARNSEPPSPGLAVARPLQLM